MSDFLKRERGEILGGESLRAAHRGYIYQDLIAAYAIVEALVDGAERIIIDRKVVPDDRVDDMEVVVASRRVRRQIKWSGERHRCLLAKDFKSTRGSLRIDALVKTRSDDPSPAEEYRLCATWSPPPDDDMLATYLEPVAAAPTIAGTTTRTFKFNASAVWPNNGTPVWKQLTDGGVVRDDFLNFCDVFVIELEMPQASLDLSSPGVVERALIDVLSRRVGVGRYPNHERRPIDVAALSVTMATTARSRGQELTPATIASNLRLEMDFGHIAQAYPLDRTVLVPRSGVRDALVETALTGGLQIVTGPPGAGKSWELTQVAEALRARGAIVARHYCYLDPSDDHVSRRITSNAFFGNLVYELRRNSSTLANARIGLAADVASLEDLLAHAAALHAPLVLIVDGLDHIARVLVDSANVARGQADIIEKLAALDIPAGIAVIVGSQPGEHLRPLHEAWSERVFLRELPPWSLDDLSSLAKAHGVEHALLNLALTKDEVRLTLRHLAECADGNPLYARALSVALRVGADAGDISSPLAWLSTAEHRPEGLQEYYRHLYRDVSAGRGTADVLGMIDFAVTEHELKEIVGGIEGGHVPRALRLLRPVLIEASAQGGFRVFHESFRRFIREQLVADGRSLDDVLEPVVNWLKFNGAFAGARSFRFLVPTLVRADRREELWSLVNEAFVGNAIAAGHAREPILANIELAAGLARRNDDFARLVRCLELRRGAMTAFGSLEGRWGDYLQGYVDVLGATALAERLLFDGRPTLERDVGLYACTLVDRYGAVPPWREYLALDSQVASGSGSSSDSAGELDPLERVARDEFRGQLRIDPDRALSTLWTVVRAISQPLKPLYLREVGACAAEVLGVQAFGSSLLKQSRIDLPPDAVCALSLGAASIARSHADEELASEFATKASAFAKDVETLMRCVDLGASASLVQSYAVRPADLAGGLGLGGSTVEAEPVREWIAALRLQARCGGGDDEPLLSEQQQVAGVGWYRSWLRYVIEIAALEAMVRADESDVIAAFNILEIDAQPFSGEPRACDLWPLRNLIEESLARGLSLLRSQEGFATVLALLSRVARDTASSISWEDVTPISTAMFSRLVLPYVSNTLLTNVSLQALEDHVANHTATHYPILACFAISVARGRAIADDHVGAQRAWKDAAWYLSAYGERKDSAVYELLEAFNVLAQTVPEVARTVVSDVQDVVDAVVAHTDGKGTNRSLNAFFRCLLGVVPVAAGHLLAYANAESESKAGWMTADALRDIVSRYLGACDPRLLEDVLRTIPLREYAGPIQVDDIDRRLAPVCAVAADEPEEGATAFRVVYAILADDGRAGATLRARACDLAAAAGVRNVPSETVQEDNAKKPSSDFGSAEDGEVLDRRQPVFVLGPTLPDLYRAIRTVAQRESLTSSRKAIWAELVEALGARLHEMLGNGEHDSVSRLLYFFARDAGVKQSSNLHPLATLADHLVDCHPREAAMAYALAYTSTRGPWFEPFGGLGHRDIIARAIAVEPSIAREVYADQLLTIIGGEAYPSGTSADVLARLSDMGDVAGVEAAWSEMLTVLRGRTPRLRDHLWIPRISEQVLATDWSVDEVVAALLLARLSEPRTHYKIAALSGVVNALRRRPSAVSRPLLWWLKLDVARTSRVLVLSALMEVECAPYSITQALVPVLLTLCASLSRSTQRYAHMLLGRIGVKPPRATALPVQAEENGPHGEAGGQFVMAAGAWGALSEAAIAFPSAIETIVRRAYGMLPEPSARRERAELMYGMRLDAYPPTAVTLWEREKLFEALDDALVERPFDAKHENRPPRAILERALEFNLAFHVGNAVSRCRRPAWLSPSRITDGLATDLTVVGDDDPAFEGWIRLGYVECECSLLDDDDDYGRPNLRVSAYAGVVTDPGNYVIPEDVYPFCEPDTLMLGDGPLIGIEMSDDWLSGWCRLRPPALLVHQRQLRESLAGEPGCWYDEAGQVAIALRTWRVVRGDPEAEPAKFAGCDLIARRDMIEELEMMYGPLRELRRTKTTAVRPRP